MAIKKEVEIDINLGNSAKDLDNVNDKLGDLGKTAKDASDDVQKTAKSAEKSGGLFKKFGSALKNIGKTISTGMGLGLGIKLFEKVVEVLSENQTIVDLVNTAFTTLSVVVNEVFSAVTDAFSAVSEANGGFEASKKVIGSLLTLGLTPLKLAFDAFKLTVLTTQLAWEKSVFGSGDDKRIKELTKSLDETKESLKETGKEAIEAGKDVYNNIGEAVGEVVNGVVEVTKAASKAIAEVDIQAAASQAKAIEQGRKNLERLSIAQEGISQQADLDAEKQRQIRDDVSKSFDDRITANTKLGEILKLQGESELVLVAKRIAILKNENALLGGKEELINQIATLENEQAGVRAKITGSESEQLTNVNSLLLEKLELKKQTNATDIEIQAINDERELANIENETIRLERERELLIQRRDERIAAIQAEVDATAEGTAQKIGLENELALYKATSQEAITKKEKEEADKRDSIAQTEQDAKIEFTSMALGQLSGILSAFSEESKGMAIAAVIVDAAVAAIGIWRGYAALGPIGIAGAALQTAALVVSTVKAISNINSASKDGGGGGGAKPSAPKETSVDTGIRNGNSTQRSLTGVATGGTTNPTGDDLSQQVNANALNDISNNTNRVIKAYVVSQDITSQQELDRRTRNSATL